MWKKAWGKKYINPFFLFSGVIICFQNFTIYFSNHYDLQTVIPFDETLFLKVIKITCMHALQYFKNRFTSGCLPKIAKIAVETKFPFISSLFLLLMTKNLKWMSLKNWEFCSLNLVVLSTFLSSQFTQCKRFLNFFFMEIQIIFRNYILE